MTGPAVVGLRQAVFCSHGGLQVLSVDASCAEAIACLAAEHFYGDQPELAIRYYRRLLQVCIWDSVRRILCCLNLCVGAGQRDIEWRWWLVDSPQQAPNERHSFEQRASAHCCALLQMGEATAEVWTNLGLSCFYAGQYDLCFSCLERGLAQADDAVLPDIWYNIGQVGRHPLLAGCCPV